jgi:hypothetical protein
MKTEQLIRAISADAATRAAPVARMLGLALLAGAAVAAILFAVRLGPRPDIALVASDPRFLFKFVVTLLLAASALALALRLARPGADTGFWLVALAAAPVLLALGVVAELLLVPSGNWGMNLIGKNWAYCLTYVPLLSLPLLAAALLALRHGAPTRPALAGAVAGLLAGGLGAALYAAHCIDDSPLFVAIWYTIAIAGVTIAGSLIGRYVLRW